MPNFLAMMVRAPRAVDLVANSASPLPATIYMATKGAGTTVEIDPPVSATCEQMANSEFATRSTARSARTIMARKSGISVLPRVKFWLYFRSSVPSFDGHSWPRLPIKAQRC